MFILVFVTVSVISVIISGLIMAPYAMTEGSSAVPSVVTWLLGVCISTIGVVFPVVYYFNLRVVKEGFDVQQLTTLVDEIGRRRGDRVN